MEVSLRSNWNIEKTFWRKLGLKTKMLKFSASEAVAGEVFLQKNSLVTFGSRVQMSGLLSLALVTEFQICVRVMQRKCVLCGCIVKICHRTQKNVLNITPAFTQLRFLCLILMPQRWSLRYNIVLKRISSIADQFLCCFREIEIKQTRIKYKMWKNQRKKWIGSDNSSV